MSIGASKYRIYISNQVHLFINESAQHRTHTYSQLTCAYTACSVK